MMPGTARKLSETARTGFGAADGQEVARIAGAYLAASLGDPHRALAAAIADALADLDEAEALRGRTVSAGYVRACPPGPDRP